MSVILAIDPGASGGLAVNVFGVVDGRAMPATGGDLVGLVQSICDAARKSGVEPVCFLEQVGGFIGKPQPGASMFQFGHNAGFLLGVLQALRIPVVMVRPQVWQKSLGLGTAASCANTREWKNKLKAEAQRRFPQLAVTLATADALLILDWALRPATQTGYLADTRGPGTPASTKQPVPMPVPTP